MPRASTRNWREKRHVLKPELQLALIPPDPNDDKNIIVEISRLDGRRRGRPFRGDLFRMYSRPRGDKGWKIECLDMHPTGLGGFKEVFFSIIGRGSWGHL